jgi:hypothetical protein
MKARTLVLCVSMALCASGCAHYAVPSYEPFLPSRHDYDAFRGSHPDVADQLLEPNYLPFMAHRMEVAGKNEDVVVFCRWDESEFPLAVHVEPPRILPELQDEFDPQGSTGRSNLNPRSTDWSVLHSRSRRSSPSPGLLRFSH